MPHVTIKVVIIFQDVRKSLYSTLSTKNSVGYCEINSNHLLDSSPVKSQVLLQFMLLNTKNGVIAKH